MIIEVEAKRPALDANYAMFGNIYQKLVFEIQELLWIMSTSIRLVEALSFATL